MQRSSRIFLKANFKSIFKCFFFFRKHVNIFQKLRQLLGSNLIFPISNGFASDVHKMEKEQEAERKRDRTRSIKYLDTKFSFSEPPPKVEVACETLKDAANPRASCHDCSLQERKRGALGTRSASACTFRCVLSARLRTGRKEYLTKTRMCVCLGS